LVAWFPRADQPVAVIMAVDEDESIRLFARLRAECIHLFYGKTPIEFGILGDE